MALVLASGSPRRKELMKYLAEEFVVRIPDVDESAPPTLQPWMLVQQLAKRKGDAVFDAGDGTDTVIAADTVVCAGGRVLGKPRNAEGAFAMLKALSGRTHTVYTGVYIRSAQKSTVFYVATEVEFYPLSTDEICDYIATGEPFDKAGGYGIQSRGALLVKGIRGDYCNVVGFPVAEIARRLRDFAI